MTLVELTQLLETTGLPVVYLAFEKTEVPDMPFITFFETGSNNFAADGKVFFPIKQVQVDLFTEKKDMASEAKVEAALSEIVWSKLIEHDDDEHCYIATYEIEI